jgi:hypothetical protein
LGFGSVYKNQNDPGRKFLYQFRKYFRRYIKDSRKFFENGLPYPIDNSKVENSAWSKIPKFQQQITPAFDNDATSEGSARCWL